MKHRIPYGKNETMDVEISDALAPLFLEANDVTIEPADTLIKSALRAPCRSGSLARFLKDATDLLIIVNDATRPTPTCTVLDSIWDEIRAIPYTFIIATGAHRSPTEEEYVQIFGARYDEIRDHVRFHDARKTEDMVFLGTSANGTEMWVNKAGITAHKILIIGSVEPHYFAGYTGGRKSFLPGIAGFKTIEQNHKMALSPSARALSLGGNPVHEDMIDALVTVKKEIFAIMTVLERNHQVYAVTAGDIHASFDAAIERANEVFCVPVREKVDIVVAVVKFPADIDLYQAQKAIENGKMALKEGGILILVAKCRYGIGGNKTFADLLGSCDTPREVLETIEKGYRLGYHKAGRIAELALWADIWAVTEVPDAEISRLFMKPFGSLQNALDAALEKKGPDADLIFLMDGSLTVPMLPPETSGET